MTIANVFILETVFHSREEIDPEYGLEDMVTSLKRGYIAGERMMDALFMRNNVFSMNGQPIGSQSISVEIPTSDDPEFKEGFSAGVSDYMEGNVVDLYELVQAVAKNKG